MLGALNRLHVWSAVGALHNPGTPAKTNQNFFFSQKKSLKRYSSKNPQKLDNPPHPPPITTLSACRRQTAAGEFKRCAGLLTVT